MTGARGGPTLRIGTRGSNLALAQSGQVATALRSAGRPAELVTVRTEGDVNRGPLATIGGTGVFVAAVRDALRSGVVDIAVHSFKDLPTAPADGICLAAVPAREDPADVLCTAGGRGLAGLAPGARVGTGSPRRAAQLLRLRPDLDIVAVRGNVGTRLSLVTSGELDGVVLARAGLARLGRVAAASHVFTPAEMLPAPAQGALAVECRAGDLADPDLAAVLAGLDDPPSRCATTAERALLAGLQAGCSAPVGALATVTDGRLVLSAAVIAADGSAILSHTAGGPATDAARIGARVAAVLLDRGAAALLGRPA